MISKKTSTFIKAMAVGGLAAGAAAITTLPAAASPLPTYASAAGDETIRGTVASIDGKYDISVRDTRGFIDHVSLHQGTIINPTGLELAPGQSVTIHGISSGSTFAANEIDTPYQNLVAVPLYGYPYGYPYGWGWGPAYHVGLHFGRGFGFGFRG
jgi:hypothetical protein